MTDWQLGTMIGALAIDFWLASTLLVLLVVLRRQCVVESTRDLRKLVGAAVRSDIYAGQDWRWRWDEYDRVSFTRMMWVWWWPPELFWRDHSFRQPRKKVGPNASQDRQCLGESP